MSVSPAPLPISYSELSRAALRTGLQHFLRHVIGLALILLTLAVSLYFTVERVGSSLKHVVEQQLNELLADSGVQLAFDSLQLVDGEGIRIRGARLTFDPHSARRGYQWVGVPAGWEPIDFASWSQRGPGAGWPSEMASWAVGSEVPDSFAGPAAPMRAASQAYLPVLPTPPTVEIDSVWLRGEWNAADLIQAKFAAESIEIDGLTLTMVVQPDQRLCWPMLDWGDDQPAMLSPRRVRINGAKLRLISSDGKLEQQVEDLSLTAQPVARPATPEETGPGPFGGDLASGWQIEGSLRWLGNEALHFQGQWDQRRYFLEGRWGPFHWHPDHGRSIEAWLPEFLRPIDGVVGWLEIEQARIEGQWPSVAEHAPQGDWVDVHGEDPSRQPFAAAGWPEVSVVGRLRDVTIQHPLLPQPILNGSARFRGDLAGLVVDELVGQVAEGNFRGKMSIQNWHSPLATLEVQGQQLPFNRRWTGVLTEKLRSAWENFRPEGWFDCQLTFQIGADGRFHRQGTVDLHNVSCQYYGFPIPLARLYGRLTVQGNDCRFDLVSEDPQCPITIEGFANDMGPDWTGKIDIRSNRYHPMGDWLLEGLKHKPASVEALRQMNLSGMLAANGFIYRPQPQQAADVRFNVAVRGAEVRHDLFPYRLFGIHGNLEVVNGRVTTDDLEGVSSTGNIRISGQAVPGQDWWCQVVGQAVELNQELYQALNSAQRAVWDQVNPRGELDHVVVQFQHDGTRLAVSVNGYQQPSTTADPSSLSIEATSFAYSLERLSGRFHYQDGQFRLQEIQGWHGPVSVAFEGHGRSDAESWELTIHDLLTGQIPIDRDIKQALPEAIRLTSERLNLAGSAAVQGSIRVVQQLEPNHTTWNWDLQLDLENAAIDVGLPVRHLHGGLRLLGHHDDRVAFCQGHLEVDSAMIEGIQLTAVRGPFWCNDRVVLLGNWVGQAPPDQRWGGQPSSLTGETLGGRVDLDGQVQLQEELPFEIQSTISNLDLAQLAARVAPETRDIAGRGYASLRFAGTSAGQHTLDGQGMVRIKDARLYEIPFFLQLLKTMQVRTPDKAAFDEGKIDFGIRGSDIELQRIELNGDAISLIGAGRANLQQELDLNFYTVLGRNRFYLPLLSDLLHAGSQQLLWISVKGTMDKPVLTRETFRALNEAVRLLMEDVDAAARLFPR